MLFVPYKMEYGLARFPWVTSAVCVICLVIFVAQKDSWASLNEAAWSFCAKPHGPMFKPILNDLMGSADQQACWDLILDIHLAEDPSRYIRDASVEHVRLAGFDTADSAAYAEGILERTYGKFAATAPVALSMRLRYVPSSWNPWTMITSSFAHANWSHILFNLVFFVAFAATVESVVGALVFGGLVIGSSVFTGIWYSAISVAVGENIPTLGLSGVVMTMIAVFAFLLPNGKIHCVFWYLPLFDKVPIPAWILAAYYIGRDIYYLFMVDYSGSTNFLSHVTGMAFGLLVGVFFLQQAKDYARSELKVHRRRAIYT